MAGCPSTKENELAQDQRSINDYGWPLWEKIAYFNGFHSLFLALFLFCCGRHKYLTVSSIFERQWIGQSHFEFHSGLQGQWTLSQRPNSLHTEWLTLLRRWETGVRSRSYTINVFIYVRNRKKLRGKEDAPPLWGAECKRWKMLRQKQGITSIFQKKKKKKRMRRSIIVTVKLSSHKSTIKVVQLIYMHYSKSFEFIRLLYMKNKIVSYKWEHMRKNWMLDLICSRV